FQRSHEYAAAGMAKFRMSPTSPTPSADAGRARDLRCGVGQQTSACAIGRLRHRLVAGVVGLSVFGFGALSCIKREPRPVDTKTPATQVAQVSEQQGASASTRAATGNYGKVK